jgi:hypothetical protein
MLWRIDFEDILTKNFVFEGASSGARGGAVRSLGGTLTVSHCLVTDNVVQGGAGASNLGEALGGGTYVLGDHAQGQECHRQYAWVTATRWPVANLSPLFRRFAVTCLLARHHRTECDECDSLSQFTTENGITLVKFTANLRYTPGRDAKSRREF